MTAAPAPRVRAGIGGWTFDAWRGGAFYPPGLRAAGELAHAARHLTTLEVNGTFHALQKPATFARWAAEVPDDFVFSVKAHRLATQRRTLADGADGVVRFIDSGIAELGAKLGPILWQLPPYKHFDADDVECFLALLPDQLDGRPLRHALEVRHPSFACPGYLGLARAYGVATVVAESPDWPCIADRTAGFVYARLMGTQADQPLGYPLAALDRWAERAAVWARGATPPDLPLVAPAESGAAGPPGDVFLYVIGGAKARNPAAAQALIERLRRLGVG